MYQTISHYELLSLFGLLLDLIGAVFLGWAFFISNFKSMDRESGIYWSSTRYVFKALAAQKAYGISGTLFLFFGFLQQLFSIILYGMTFPTLYTLLFLIFFNLLLLIFILLLKIVINRYYLTLKYLRDVFWSDLHRDKNKRIGDLWKILKVYSRAEKYYRL
ncbi:hypothetical protein [Halobacillus karajensis]|uniref:Uncharacterized protein n=1 Tax=Halobacillus karajensis TaxID=195088 RepID=A0A059NXU8_9BACI|nr:hypothetical protein [Halobacillus karajensis]CDQ20334.1 hypothetical protein BN982_02663 [Halobacillus karajensis]CDQ23598.1 hypothetical protein BN983_01844 [Halobacillus karajensis]CDQ27077.1 hypothetical protein BN981_01326 [Halobacillus karajensis]